MLVPDPHEIHADPQSQVSQVRALKLTELSKLTLFFQARGVQKEGCGVRQKVRHRGGPQRSLSGEAFNLKKISLATFSCHEICFLFVTYITIRSCKKFFDKIFIA